MNKLNKHFDLTAKTGLITGAAGLLGLEHAYALLEHGSKVILTDININKLREFKDKLKMDFDETKIDIKFLDVTSEENIISVSTEIINEGSRVDILINNAAIDAKFDKTRQGKNRSRLENFSLDDWNKEISVGLTGYFLCSKIFGTLMAEDGLGGNILNIASDLSVISPDNRIYKNDKLKYNDQAVKPITYSVIKTGILGMTRYLSTYWADRGVRANSLSPGGVYTSQNDQFVKKIIDLIPLGRMAKANEYRSAVQFLCSDASNYMTGQNIVMDGGRSVW